MPCRNEIKYYSHEILKELDFTCIPPCVILITSFGPEYGSFGQNKIKKKKYFETDLNEMQGRGIILFYFSKLIRESRDHTGLVFLLINI